MRNLLAAGFFAALVLGGIAIAGLSLRDDAASERAHRASIALEGAANLLAERHGLELESLAAGRALSADRYDFRGALASERARGVPVYGVVELTCDALSGDPGCWRLVALERDGASWDPSETEATAGAIADTAENTADPGAGGEAPTSAEFAAPAPAVDAQPEPEPAPSGPASEPEPDSGEPDAEGEAAGTTDVEPPREAAVEIYRVTEPVVNGRAGPGTDRAIVAKITPEMRLELRQRQDDWGRFSIAGEAGSETDPLWIWMPLVQPQNGDSGG